MPWVYRCACDRCGTETTATFTQGQTLNTNNEDEFVAFGISFTVQKDANVPMNPARQVYFCNTCANNMSVNDLATFLRGIPVPVPQAPLGGHPLDPIIPPRVLYFDGINPPV